MIKKTFSFSLLALTAILFLTSIPQAEARSHCRSCTNFHVSVGSAYNEAPVARRYVRPVAVPVVPVYPQPALYAPVYAPVYAYPAPTYVEEVYVTPAPRRIGLGGFSFSWNFFK